MASDWALSKAADYLFGDNFPSGAEVHIKRLADLLDEAERRGRGAANDEAHRWMNPYGCGSRGKCLVCHPINFIGGRRNAEELKA